MKQVIYLVLFLAAVGCSSPGANNEAAQPTPQTAPKDTVDFKTLGFEELYKSVEPKALDVNIFTLLNEDWNVVTAGTESDYNSMIASWGGYGYLFEKPTAWLFLNASRYTLEKIKEKGTYTLSYLDSRYKEQKMLLGAKSGRDTDKMKESTLTPVQTPSGNITYKEAYMVVELQLEGLSELKPSDFKTEANQKFIIDGKEKGNGKEYHRLVSGTITHIWVRK